MVRASTAHAVWATHRQALLLHEAWQGTGARPLAAHPPKRSSGFACCALSHLTCDVVFGYGRFRDADAWSWQR